jgi:hypothetical protein
MVSKLKGVKSKSIVTAILHLYIKRFTSYSEVSKKENKFVETRSFEKEFIETFQENWTSNNKVIILSV